MPSSAVAEPRPYKIPRSVLVVIYTAELQVLLIERAGERGLWQSVTGSLDAEDEALATTAWREVFEETGIDNGTLLDWNLVNDYEIYPRWRARYAPGVLRNIEHVFGLRVPAGISVRLSPREHQAHAWLPWADAADRCFSPSNAAAIRLLPQYASP